MSDVSDPEEFDLDGQDPAGGQQAALGRMSTEHATAAAETEAGAGVGRRYGAAGVGGVDDDEGEGELDDEAASAAHGYSCCYSGHRNALTSRNAVWLGGRGEYVASGSDDGCLYVWAAGTGELVTVLRGGDKAVKRMQVGGTASLVHLQAS